MELFSPGCINYKLDRRDQESRSGLEGGGHREEEALCSRGLLEWPDFPTLYPQTLPEVPELRMEKRLWVHK